MRSIFTVPLLFLAIWTFAQAPANDNCGGLIDLGVAPVCQEDVYYSNDNAPWKQ